MENAGSNSLGTEKIGKLIVKLALPSVFAQIINVLYNIVDRIYIGHIPENGDLALTGLGLTFPILMLVAAFGSLIGMGGAPLASIELGRGAREKAQKILGNSVFLAVLFSVILFIFFQYFKVPFLYLFGASDQTITFAVEYIEIYLIGTFCVMVAIGLNMFITAQGKAGVAMVSVLLGAVTNIILDPVFIFVFQMGVKGAAIATVISQTVSAVWILRFLLSPKTDLRIRKKDLRLEKGIVLGIVALGISGFTMQATESLINVVLNSNLQKYGGDLYVGSLTIIQSVMQLIIVPVNGFTSGVQPIISYNYGAGNLDRVKRTFRISLVVAFSAATICCIGAVSFPEFFAGFFTSNEELMKLAASVMPIYLGSIWIFGIQMACQSAFVGLGQAGKSLFVALLRKVFLLTPLAIFLPMKFGVMGIYYSEPIATFVSAVTAGLLFLITYKTLLSPKSKEVE